MTDKLLQYASLTVACFCFLVSIIYSILIPKSELGPFQKCVTLMMLSAFSITNIITYLTVIDEKADWRINTVNAAVFACYITPSIILTVRYMTNNTPENLERKNVDETIL